MTGTLAPASGRPDLARVAALPASWYANQPIPTALITDIGKAPLVPEWAISSLWRGTKLKRASIPSLRVAEIAALAAMGLSNDETAARLGVSLDTAKHERRKLIYAMRARNITQAVACSVALGFITPGGTG